MFLFIGTIPASGPFRLKGSFKMRTASRSPVPGVAMAACSPVNVSPTETWEEKRIWRAPHRSLASFWALNRWPNTVLYINTLQGNAECTEFGDFEVKSMDVGSCATHRGAQDVGRIYFSDSPWPNLWKLVVGSTGCVCANIWCVRHTES